METWVMLRGYSGGPEGGNGLVSGCTDMWVHLWDRICALAGVCGVVLYKGTQRISYTSETPFVQIATTDLIKELQELKPSLVFDRGGYDDFYRAVARLQEKAFKIYYGAGRRFIPADPDRYDMILLDSERQVRDSIRGKECIFRKSAAPHFYPRDVEKKYDVCFVAREEQAAIKGVEWFYKTIPQGMTALHLGGAYSRAAGVDAKRVSKAEMPIEISSCRVGVAPYWACIDSAPRAVIEMLACGLPVVAAENLIVAQPFVGATVNEDGFWDMVQAYLDLHCRSEVFPATIDESASEILAAIRMHYGR